MKSADLQKSTSRPDTPQERGVPQGKSSQSAPSPAGPKRSKKVLTTADEFARPEQYAVKIGAQLGVSLDFSNVTRALWEIYVRYEEDILRSIPEGTAWYRTTTQSGWRSLMRSSLTFLQMASALRLVGAAPDARHFQ